MKQSDCPTPHNTCQIMSGMLHPVLVPMQYREDNDPTGVQAEGH